MRLLQTQTQKQILTEKMIQSVNILQMGVQDLTTFLTDVSMENPLVDIEAAKEADEKAERVKKLEWLDAHDEQNRVYYRDDSEDSDKNDIGNLAESTHETLSDHLLSQLIGREYDDDDMRLFEYIALSLDNRGFYTGTAQDAASFCDLPVEKAQEALAVMRSLDPAGVCAENLSACLLKQLEKNGIDDTVASAIASSHLEALAKNRMQEIAKALSVSVSEAKRARDLIRSLNPTPASGFSDRRTLRYIRPDVTVVKLEGYFEILVNDRDYPSMRVNRDYLKMLKSDDTPQDVKDYLHEKLKQAEEIQAFLLRRNDTLSKLAHVLVEKQEPFFMSGAPLKPLTMREAAEACGVHESTISRAVRDKYLQCWRGLYPLGFFFSRSLHGASTHAQDAGTVSVAQAKERISNLVGEEDPHRPYSDEKLKELLNVQGIPVSRRTVAKYREELRIPDSRARKR